MTDERTREHERQAAGGDLEAAAAVLRERVRSGELTQEHVELAASLGHPAARVVCPGLELLGWAFESRRDAIQQVTLLLEAGTVGRIAADYAERLLPSWEGPFPDDPRPTRAIAAAREWSNCPCESHARAASGAADAARAAVIQAGGTPDPAALDAASHAAYASSCAAEAPLYAHNAAASVYPLTDDEAEREWQRLRLAAYVLREV